MGVVHIEQLFNYQRCQFSMLELNARYDWQVEAPNTHHSLFPISLLCVLTCLTWKLQDMYGHSAHRMTAKLLDAFLVWFRVAWANWLESYSPGHTSVILQYNIACMYYKFVHTLLFGMQLSMATKFTYLMTAYYSPNNGFTANNASRCKSKVG